MDRQQADRVIKKAKSICDESGVRLTQKRERIFEIMLLAGMPLSAYEIASRLSYLLWRSQTGPD